ncbi:MAG: hypothetical protein EBR82_48975 [Caulobacteraceae bacterium]|nr:hypothetical protein [Caulobacteraceae bacterium]
MEDIKVTPKVAEPTTSDEVTSEEKQNKPQSINDNHSDSDLALIKLGIASLFDIKDTEDSKFSFVFNELYDQYGSKGAIMEAIRNIERITGTPRRGLGESKLGLIFNYLKTEKTINDSIKVRNSYLR